MAKQRVSDFTHVKVWILAANTEGTTYAPPPAEYHARREEKLLTEQYSETESDNESPETSENKGETHTIAARRKA